LSIILDTNSDKFHLVIFVIMKKMELTINNPYATKILREDRKPTVFKRAMARLSDQGLNPGKIIPIFTYINGNYKIFGILTLNIGGSVSFFPDFYQLDNFDHLTLSTNFIEKKGHLTKVAINGKHRKSLHLEASEMLNGNYCLITFAMVDDDLLMDAPPQIEYTEIHYNNEEEGEKYNTWINESVSSGHCILTFPEGDGSYCVQVLILPKGRTTEGLAVNRDPIEKFLLSPISLEEKVFIVKKIEIPTSERSDFSICMLTFKVPYELKGPFGFMMAQNPAKPLTENREPL
jgi:hypothetical protein